MPLINHAEHRLVHQITLPIRWGDMDSLAHLNNTIYFRLMEQCRIEWFDSFQQILNHSVPVVPVLVSANCNFIRAITYPSSVLVTLHLGKATSRSLETYHDLIVEGKVHAQGECRLVWISNETGRAVSVPDKVLAMIKDA
jgi:acyl-CoA thioester hydrolase